MSCTGFYYYLKYRKLNWNPLQTNLNLNLDQEGSDLFHDEIIQGESLFQKKRFSRDFLSILYHATKIPPMFRPRVSWKYRATTSKEEDRSGRWPTRGAPKNEDVQSLPWPVVLGSTRPRLSLSTLQQLRKQDSGSRCTISRRIFNFPS